MWRIWKSYKDFHVVKDMLDIRGTKTEENIEKDICEKAKLSVRLRLYGRQAEKDGYKYIADIFNENADRLE